MNVILLYIDPGMGFMALQVIGASFLGALFVFRQKVLSITTYVKTRFRRKAR